MHFHLMKSIFTVFHCTEADNFTLDSTAVTAEVAGDSCFVSIRMACVPGSFFSSVTSVDLA